MTSQMTFEFNNNESRGGSMTSWRWLSVGVELALETLKKEVHDPKNGVRFEEREVRAYLQEYIWDGTYTVSKTVYRRVCDDLIVKVLDLNGKKSLKSLLGDQKVWSLKVDELGDLQPRLLHLVKNLIEREARRAEARKEKKMKQKAEKGRSRVRYRQSGTLVLKNERVLVDTGVRNPGALERFAAVKGWDSKSPIAMPFVSEDHVELGDEIVPADMQERFIHHGYFPAAGKTLWDKSSPAWLWAAKNLPTAVEFIAYGQGLVNSACVEFHNLAEEGVTVRVVDLGVDENGHWTYDPEEIVTPAGMDGACVYGAGISDEALLQCRYLNDEQFAKGLWVQSDSVPDKEFWIDRGVMNGGQFKGAMKSVFKKLPSGSVIDPGCLGVLAAHGKFNHMRRMQSGFEVWENAPVTEENKALLMELASENADKIISKGKDRIEARIASEDPFRAAQLQLFKLAGKNPWAVKSMRSSMVDYFQQTLWKLAQGAGVTGRRVFSVIDNGVRPGCVVANKAMFPGAEYGDTVAAWRFPITHEQGAQVFVLVEPSARHLVDGKMPMDVAYFHEDRHAAGNGDDDGDTWAFTNDPRMVKVISSFNGGWVIRDGAAEPLGRRYSFEPVKDAGGSKHSYSTESDEARAYVNRDNRGPVGRPTMWRATFRVLGDDWAALAMSVMIQYFVDMAKRTVNLPDWRYIADFPEKAWVPVDGRSGWFKLADDVPLLGWVNTPDGPAQAEIIEMMTEWFNARVIDHGVPSFEIENDKGDLVRVPVSNLLGWRSFKRDMPVLDHLGQPTGQFESQKFSKVIHLDHWTSTTTRQKKIAKGNLVHESFDYAQSRKDEFLDMLGADDDLDDEEMIMAELLDDCFNAVNEGRDSDDQVVINHDAVAALIDKAHSQGYLTSTLRRKSGLATFADSWGRIAAMRGESVEQQSRQSSAKRNAIARLENDVRSLTLEECLAIWHHEVDRKRYNNALRIVATPGNAIARALDLDNAGDCRHLDSTIQVDGVKKTRATAYVDAIFAKTGKGAEQDIFDAMTEFVKNDVDHLETCGIHFHECEHCMQQMLDLLVIRHRQTGRKLTLDTWHITQVANDKLQGDNSHEYTPRNYDWVERLARGVIRRHAQYIGIRGANGEAHRTENWVYPDEVRPAMLKFWNECVAKGLITADKPFTLGFFVTKEDAVFRNIQVKGNLAKDVAKAQATA